MLKKSAVGASVGATGLSQSVIATRDTESDELEEFEALPEVQSILDKLGETGLPGVDAPETKELVGDTIELVVTEVEFEYGILQIGQINGETSAAFAFEWENPSNGEGNPHRRDEGRGNAHGRTNVPEQYREIPAGTTAWLLGDDDETVFRRTATDREREVALTEVQVSGDQEAVAYTESDVDGIFVNVFDTSEDELKAWRYVLPAEDVATFDPESTEISSVGSPELIAHSDGVSGEVSVQFAHDNIPDPREYAKDVIETTLPGAAGDCGYEAGECVAGIITSISSCYRCAPGCAAGSTGVGAVVCVACVFAMCSHVLTGTSCVGPNGAVACLEDNGHI
ncbi:hypothetical protein BB347_01015 [Natronorubrum daqingense]|uniref:Uncharacterized protein n=1 Tax=Natronorubrum daqingense TaxID=588898 RepID=A0A1P8R9D4_9EURY|nr:hypothetical protein BB347_01015 [Natronorubrum daqingense]